ncbi:MAG: hypothetical protein V3U82_09250 [Robiginitomaculum sp.]
MKLSVADFRERLEAGTLRISFIGMSNIGKSHTARRLRISHGFTLYEVDEAIQHELGLKTMQESADWMGFPYAPNYAAREAEYLALESRLTSAALDGEPQNLILDTTGSVIYADDSTLDALKAQTLIIHIRAEAKDLARLEKLYFRAPKPLIWAGQYSEDAGQSQKQALKACYPSLLESRMDAYDALADIGLSTSLLQERATTPQDIISAIEDALVK